MQFTWDEAKRQSNLRKHGYDFADANRVFGSPVILSHDGRNDYGEQRIIALGILDAVVVAVVHVEADETIRIISMRKGDRDETNIYFEEFGCA